MGYWKPARRPEQRMGRIHRYGQLKDCLIFNFVAVNTREGRVLDKRISSVEGVSPNFLTRYWPPALSEWSTKAVRDAFFASPKFPRLLKADAVRETISRGLDAGLFAYVGRSAGGQYEPLVYKRSLAANDVEISEDMFLISRERAEEYVKAREAGTPANADR
jgi:hypothetical protein